jgi:chemotaxis family two-component system sensor kinase Cph1
MSTQSRNAASPTRAIASPKALREFVTTSVHDLREPLRSIRIATERLERNPSPETLGQTVEEIHRSVARAEALIRDIADYWNLELRTPQRAPVDMEEVLHEAQKELAAEIKSSGATVTHDALPAVRGDAAMLKDLLIALIRNSLVFRSEAPPQIHVGARAQHSEWVFSVQDNGLGFDPVYAERIFRPFERLYGKRYPGSGLGLALARNIVIRHGGRIWAESEAGKGATFRFVLPAAE